MATIPRVRYDYISALRGLAAVAVVAFHTYALQKLPLPDVLGAYAVMLRMAVNFFFCLSAFTLALAFESSDRSSIAFYLRRFFRIAPLFYLVSLYYVARWGIPPLKTILLNLAFVFNFDLSSSTYRGIAMGAWSIGVEMPFYAMFPFVFAWASTLRRAVVMTVASLVVSYAFRRLLAHWAAGTFFASHGWSSPESFVEAAGQSVVVNLPFFGLGLIAYHCVKRFATVSAETRNDAGRLLLVVAAIVLVSVPELVETNFLTDFIPSTYLLGLAFSALIVSFALAPQRVFVNRYTIFCGDISYSLYLVHIVLFWVTLGWLPRIDAMFWWPVAGYLAAFLFLLSLSIAASYVTYRLIERPGIAFGLRVEEAIRGRRSRTAPIELSPGNTRS